MQIPSTVLHQINPRRSLKCTDQRLLSVPHNIPVCCKKSVCVSYDHNQRSNLYLFPNAFVMTQPGYEHQLTELKGYMHTTD